LLKSKLYTVNTRNKETNLNSPKQGFLKVEDQLSLFEGITMSLL